MLQMHHHFMQCLQKLIIWSMIFKFKQGKIIVIKIVDVFVTTNNITK